MDFKLGNIFKGDKVIWMVFFFLCIISVVEVYSASSELTYKGGNFIQPVVKHVGLLFLGVIFMIGVVNIDCRFFRLATPIVLPLAFATLFYLFLKGQITNGAARWLNIMGLQFQPSELGKAALVMATAQILSAMQTKKGADRMAMRYILFTSAFIVPLILFENLSTALLICFVLFVMMWVGRVPLRQLGTLLGVVMLMGCLVFGSVMLFGKDNSQEQARNHLTEQTNEGTRDVASRGVFHRLDTWKSRIDKFLHAKEVSPSEVDLDKDGQRAHAYIAIATSNVVGKGPGNSVERDFLSQAFSDFIYAIIVEETGMIGATFVAVLYIILLFRTGRIADRCANTFPAMLVMGLAVLLVTQAMFNMAVAVGWLPVTGQPLPLISKGGTSGIINCIYIGMIISVSRTAKRKVASTSGQGDDSQTEESENNRSVKEHDEVPETADGQLS